MRRPGRAAVLRRVLWVAQAEWRWWWRSRLALLSLVLTLLLLIATTAATALRMQAQRAERLHHQAQAEATFLAQPARHPHRMVHYGHYVFRTPAPLALLDPGLDPVTGQAIFLEGHRQNTAMFSQAGASAALGSVGGLSPARVLQLFGPLLIILLGFGALAREREAGTLASLLAQGTSGGVLLAGKALALLGVVALLLLPLACGAALSVSAGPGGAEAMAEPWGAAWALMGVWGLYLAVWVLLVLLVSVLPLPRSGVLAALATVWVAAVLVLPALAASAAAQGAPAAGKLETDLAMLADLRKLGDGHNANDPAFAQLRAQLLARHGVQRVEDLPFNLRGVVAEHAEQKLTATLNAYAAAQRAAETRQARVLSRHGWLSPALAVAEASRAVAATDLAHHHRFLQEAEALRYAFVQGLNKVHAEQLAYADDVRRSRDAEAERRTRVDPRHWQLLDRFRLAPDPLGARLARAASPTAMLLAWLCVLGAALGLAASRLKP